MKKCILWGTIFFILSCKREEGNTLNQPKQQNTTSLVNGKTLFEGEGNCIACHQPDQKIIGPSIHEIAKTYIEKNASIVSFLREESEPIIDPSQYDIMKANFAITKEMSDEQLKAIENYIFSFSK